MTFIVPFDGSPLAEAALVRAVEFSTVLEEEVLAVTVIPEGNAEYAREHGWIGSNERFDAEVVISKLHNQVTDLCPTAGFEYEIVDKYAPPGTISSRIRKQAKKEDASIVFIGSDNAGTFVASISSVGSSVAADEAYDVMVVRHRIPSKIKKLKESSPYRTQKSDFYIPE
jgi:nucleotide-binding universal stress UspA family protein